jgi:hypothetical protein
MRRKKIHTMRKEKKEKKTTQKPNKNHYTMRIKKTAQNERKNHNTHKYTTTKTPLKTKHIQIYNNTNNTKTTTYTNIRQPFHQKTPSNIPPPPPLSNKPPKLKPSENLTLDQRINIPHESSYPSQVKICT